MFFKNKIDVPTAAALIANIVSQPDSAKVEDIILDISKELDINKDYIKNELLYLKGSVGYLLILERYGNATYMFKPVGAVLAGTYVKTLEHIHTDKYMFKDFMNKRCVEYSVAVRGDNYYENRLLSKDGLDKLSKRFGLYLSDKGCLDALFLGLTVGGTLCKAILYVLKDIKITI